MTLPPGGSDGSKLVCNYTVLLHHMALDVAGEPKVCLTHHVAALGCGMCANGVPVLPHGRTGTWHVHTHTGSVKVVGAGTWQA